MISGNDSSHFSPNEPLLAKDLKTPHEPFTIIIELFQTLPFFVQDPFPIDESGTEKVLEPVLML